MNFNYKFLFQRLININEVSSFNDYTEWLKLEDTYIYLHKLKVFFDLNNKMDRKTYKFVDITTSEFSILPNIPK